ncbi:MAG TPA: ubiquitin-like domain-containing protein [Anaerolineaceae bacterium]|jgi:uncharacterized protein YabE (DUF348 family)
MIKIRTQWIAALLVAAGLVLIAIWFYRPIQVSVDGQTVTIRSTALTTGGVLRSAGVLIHPSDSIRPDLTSWLIGANRVDIHRAQSVQVLSGSKQASLITPQKVIGNLLSLAGFKLYPGDAVLLNGQPVDPQQALPSGSAALIQYRPAVPVTLQAGGQQRTLFSSAATLGQALWENGVRLAAADRLFPPATTPLDQPLTAQVKRARDLTITSAGKQFHLMSTADRVGQALGEAGLALQGLDYTQPAEDQPIPANGLIRLINVYETVLLQQKQLPFKTSTQPDPNTELDQTRVITPGIPGIQVTRVRVLNEDGKEVSRQSEAEWIARQPQNQVLGYGTNVVIHTEVVEGVTLHYYRKITVYATSYTDCDAGHCNGGTASGAKVTRGVVAVIPSWYSYLQGAQVYIPGYGQATIEDVGGGIPGTNWIDLGYSVGEYQSWHSNVTLYFLAPAPANVPWRLP